MARASQFANVRHSIKTCAHELAFRSPAERHQSVEQRTTECTVPRSGHDHRAVLWRELVYGGFVGLILPVAALLRTLVALSTEGE